MAIFNALKMTRADPLGPIFNALKIVVTGKPPGCHRDGADEGPPPWPTPAQTHVKGRFNRPFAFLGCGFSRRSAMTSTQ